MCVCVHLSLFLSEEKFSYLLIESAAAAEFSIFYGLIYNTSPGISPAARKEMLLL